MINSNKIFKLANDLTNFHNTRDTIKLAKQNDIKVVFSDEFEHLLGMYTYKWRHRIIILNNKLDKNLEQMVCGHELGHDFLHRNLANEQTFCDEGFLINSSKLEYEANAFCAHILIDTDEILQMCKDSYSTFEIASYFCIDENLVLIKLNELIKLGHDLTLPANFNNRFFLSINI